MLYSDLVASEEFLGSHVLRIPIHAGSLNLKEENNVRDNRGKARQVTTFNGRTVIIKDNSIYSNKGRRPPKVYALSKKLTQAMSNQDSNPSRKLNFFLMRFTILRSMNHAHG